MGAKTMVPGAAFVASWRRRVIFRSRRTALVLVLGGEVGAGAGRKAGGAGAETAAEARRSEAMVSIARRSTRGRR